MNLRYLLSSIALLVPCFWLPRIQAGDLSSHIYNAWLAQLIAQGQAPGLRIDPQWTNVLFDLELSALWRFGPEAAQKIAVALAVLIFAWGAFAFVAAVTRRQPWFMLPIIGILAYGWVFHAGFFNFYLSLGLCFWALALVWPRQTSLRRIAGAVAILALAYTAHALPLVWAIGAIAYRRLAVSLRPRHRGKLILAAVALLVIARVFIQWRIPSLWYPQQAIWITGSDQIWIRGVKYQFLQAALLAVWGILLDRLLERGWMRLAVSIPLQIALVTAAAIAILPSKILVPGYHHAMVFIAERMSLAIAVCACAVLASARPQRLELRAIGGLAAVFCACLLVDARALNRIEDGLQRALARVPQRARVVSTISSPPGRTDPLVHLIDRACIGRCFSYANYEPSTAQFRIRAAPGNPVVVSDYGDSYALQTGKYRVKSSDLPLYVVSATEDDESFAVRVLVAAEPILLSHDGNGAEMAK